MVTAIVLVNADPEHLAELGRRIADVEGVDVCYSVAGDEDLVAIVRAVEHEALARLVTEHISPMPGVTATRTLIAFREYSSADLRNV